MNSKLDGPLVSAFESSTEGVVLQEFTTYHIKDGCMRKEVTTRRFDSIDYYDSTTTTPLKI